MNTNIPNNLLEVLNELETKIPYLENLNKEISQSNVAWHIEHSLLTINGIIEQLSKANPKEYRWKFNFPRMMVLMRKKISRGSAKSPKVVQPKGIIDEIMLQKHIEEARKKITNLLSISTEHFFEHPILGKLSYRQTISFLEIHTKHHLKIIKDILNR